MNIFYIKLHSQHKTGLDIKPLFLIAILAALAPLNNLLGQSCVGEQGKLEWYIFENIPKPNYTKLRAEQSYPSSPIWIDEVSTLSTVKNYNESFGSLLRGYIKAPETGTYTFNTTGDHACQFFLSTDTFPSNKILTCEAPNRTGGSEHNKFTEQTSAPVNLVQDEYYYFELIHVEDAGEDFAYVFWKTPSNNTNWELIGPESLFKYDCAISCPLAGTPCDDGDATTENDLEDGHCNCMGTPISKPACVGERGSLLALYYDGISGQYIQEMYNDPDYPLSPDRGEYLDRMFGPADLNAHDNYGTRLRGFLRVPVTGDYIFNACGDDEMQILLSPNPTTTPADLIARNPIYNNQYNFYHKAEQTSDPIQLNAGQFYAIEILHKQGTGVDHFQLFWKTPFAQDTIFQLMSGIYLYQYDCETACIPAGVPCDDGDPATFDDQYDGNCNCTGTPCVDPECTNALSYTPYEPCNEKTNRHTTNPDYSWTSCETSPSPNPIRGDSHWIQYDFGEVYSLNDAQIWNYNATGSTGEGLQTVVIDYSLNGSSWVELGTFTWDQATGTTSYNGFSMTEFADIKARYVLITAIDNFNSSNCFGLSEIYFNATSCPDVGEPCDDGNPLTINDQYNEACNCRGEFTPTNPCDAVDAVINDNPIPTAKYGAENSITSAGTVRSGSNVLFVAGDHIDLVANFEVVAGAEFTALIAPCTAPRFKRLKNNLGIGKKDGQSKKKYRKRTPWLKIEDNEKGVYKAIFNLPKRKKISIGIYDELGTFIGWILQEQKMAKGEHIKNIPVGKFDPGIYRIALFVDESAVTEVFEVVEEK